MCIRAYLNGDGIGYKTHLSIFFVIMRGEYDPLLKWPFEHKVSIILVDQNHRYVSAKISVSGSRTMMVVGETFLVMFDYTSGIHTF